MKQELQQQQRARPESKVVPAQDEHLPSGQASKSNPCPIPVIQGQRDQLLWIFLLVSGMLVTLAIIVVLWTRVADNNQGDALPPSGNTLSLQPRPHGSTLTPAMPSSTPSHVPTPTPIFDIPTVPSWTVSPPVRAPTTHQLRRPTVQATETPSATRFWWSPPGPTAEPSPARSCATYPAPPSFPGRKGIGFVLRDAGYNGSWVENLPKVEALRPYWNYRWGLSRLNQQPSDIEFVPMMWGWSDKNNLSNYQRIMRQQVLPQIQSGQAKRFLGFNEPDNAKQSNVDVSTAVQAWRLLEWLNVSLVSPSCVHADDAWMTQFMAAADRDCLRVDWVGVHWYGSPNFPSFRQQMRSIYKRYNRSLVVTEFAVADWQANTTQDNRYSPAAVLDFAKQALPWLESQPYIAGYAWFAFTIDEPAGTSSALFDQYGNLLALGRYYASITTDNPMGNQSITADS